MRSHPAPDLLHKFVTAKGQVERAVSTEGWILPQSVELEDGRLTYRFGEPFKRRKPGVAMLKGFLELADAKAQKILDYATAWGPLHVPTIDAITGAPRNPDRNGSNQFERILDELDSLDGWRLVSKQMGEILHLADELRIQVEKTGMGMLSTEQRYKLGQKQQRIVTAINVWLFSVRPQLTIDGDRWAIRLHVDSLCGALVAQLMLMIARKDGLGICGNCGAPFETDGKRKVYCVGCGRQAAVNAASRKLYRAKKAAGRMFQQGKTIKEIAAELDRPPRRVRGWLS